MQFAPENYEENEALRKQNAALEEANHCWRNAERERKP